MLKKEEYNYKPWDKKYPNNIVRLDKLYVHKSWRTMFAKEYKKEYFVKLEKYLSDCLKKTRGEINIYPYPDLLFNAFNKTPLSKIKVVILGQDPYFKNEVYKGKIIPQAMGLSFSVPKGITIPSSLNNIYKNLLKYNHIKEKPTHGNLVLWAYQGCLMLNTALTVQHGHKNSHAKYWRCFTDSIISYISRKCENCVFILWGAPALEKLRLIDTREHKVIISSHPSGLSCNKPLRSYLPFTQQDHFGETNRYLKKHGKRRIRWQI